MARTKAKDDQKAEAPEAALAYIGPGYIFGIPDTDLSADELAAIAERKGDDPGALAAELIGSGLYAAGPAMPAPAAAPEEGES